MTVVGATELRKLLYNTSGPNRLVVTPLLDREKQIEGHTASIDIRLGKKFIILKRANVAAVDPADKDFQEQFSKSAETVHIPYGESLILHPRQFVLGNSIEYFCLPYNLSGYVLSRSSWGRLGLVVATAIGIHPGFRGVLCLELSNLGELPMSLYPGLIIAQVFFHKVTAQKTTEEMPSAYNIATEVELPRFNLAEDLKTISKLEQ
jgi:dCTP deaminase